MTVKSVAAASRASITSGMAMRWNKAAARPNRAASHESTMTNMEKLMAARAVEEAATSRAMTLPMRPVRMMRKRSWRARRIRCIGSILAVVFGVVVGVVSCCLGVVGRLVGLGRAQISRTTSEQKGVVCAKFFGLIPGFECCYGRIYTRNGRCL